ncbi:HET domain containing protein [Rhypophila decipiens]
MEHLPSSRLCIFCRRLEDGSSDCPTLRGLDTSNHLTLLQPDPVTPPPASDDVLLEKLQSSQPSILCPRCKDYDIVRVFRDASPLDLNQQAQEFGTSNAQHEAYQRYISQYSIPPSRQPLSSLVLDASCPLCRLIYRILPRKNLDPRDNMLQLVPFRSHLRMAMWERMPREMRNQNAILLGVAYPDFMTPWMLPSSAKDAEEQEYGGSESMLGEAICLSPRDVFPGRDRGNFRFVRPMVNFDLPRGALDSCLRACPTGVCQVPLDQQPVELRTTTMIDVEKRVTVPFPFGEGEDGDKGCEYLALSYVWGGVMPHPDGLANGTLPQTIEDAITVTRELGRRYLWVDALCIDQSLHPTSAQLACKMQQLSIMDMIYGCAALTLVAMSGSDSNAGLAGVSERNPRSRQWKETIDGLEFFTVPPVTNAEKEASGWEARAWTLQEGLLSRRKLYFTQSQMYFQCQCLATAECEDGSGISEDEMNEAVKRALHLGGANDMLSKLRVDWYLHGYLGLLQTYTSRKMTDPRDALNALRGILSAWERNLLPPGHRFLWGLPLTIAPQFLGWMHDRSVGPRPSRRRCWDCLLPPDLPREQKEIKRRHCVCDDFPSWSWVGWEQGAVDIDPSLPEGVYSSEKIKRVGDLGVEILGVDDGPEGKRLRVRAWVVNLRVRTEPFSEVVVEARNGDQVEEKVLGSVKERNLLHNTTIPTGAYECLVVERVRVANVSQGMSGRETVKVFMLVLDRLPDTDGWSHGGGPQLDHDMMVRERKTMITLTMFRGGEFGSTGPVKRSVTLV